MYKLSVALEILCHCGAESITLNMTMQKLLRNNLLIYLDQAAQWLGSSM
jgi:hypothetical protein